MRVRQPGFVRLFVRNINSICTIVTKKKLRGTGGALVLLLYDELKVAIFGAQ